MCDKQKNKNVYMGTFDAESFWRNNLSNLPFIADKETENIVLAMDELLAPLCCEGDILLTRFKMDESHKDYLYEIGFRFENNRIDIVDDTPENSFSKDKSVFELLYKTADDDYFKKLAPGGSRLLPFAVVPFIDEVCSKYSFTLDAPSAEGTIKCNSKIYSNQIKERAILGNIGKVAESSSEIEEMGKELLKESPFLIKDEFGVSGKGNILINSESTLSRVVSYTLKQEKCGKNTRFVLEPLLNKKIDFSCQIYIEKSGSYSVISVQKIVNNGFSYQGSFIVEDEFYHMLEKNGYFIHMRDIAKLLFEDGYFGHVCIDSMILDNGEIVPMVEINARMSMSLIKHYIDKYLSKFSLLGCFTYYFVSYSGGMQFADIINGLENEGILFRPNGERGIIPLTSNTLFINRQANKLNSQKPFKGRLYVYIAYKSYEDYNFLSNKIRSFLIDNGFKIHN